MVDFSRMKSSPITAADGFTAQSLLVNDVNAASEKASKTHFKNTFTLVNVPLPKWIWALAAMNLGATKDFKSLPSTALPASLLGFTRNACYVKRHKHMQILFKRLQHKRVTKRYSRGRNFECAGRIAQNQ